MKELKEEEPNRIRRRIQKTGGSTYIISLPKDWVDSQDVSVRSELEIYPLKDKLIIKKIKEEKRAKIIEFSNKNINYIKREIISAYIHGENRILIKGVEGWRDRARMVEFIQDYLIGMDVVSEEKEILVQIIINPHKITIDDSFERLIELVKWMLYGLSDMLLHPEKIREEIIRHIISRDKEVDKQNIFIKRLSMSELLYPSYFYNLDESKLLTISSVSSILENISDLVVERAKVQKVDLTTKKTKKGDINRVVELWKKEGEIVEEELNFLNAIFLSYKSKDKESLSKIADDIKARLRTLRDSYSSDIRGKEEVGFRIINILHLEKDLAEEMFDLV